MGSGSDSIAGKMEVTGECYCTTCSGIGIDSVYASHWLLIRSSDLLVGVAAI